MSNKEFKKYFQEHVEPGINPKDKPALRQAWNDLIDSMCRNGELPKTAKNWSHPNRFK